MIHTLNDPKTPSLVYATNTCDLAFKVHPDGSISTFTDESAVPVLKGALESQEQFLDQLKEIANNSGLVRILATQIPGAPPQLKNSLNKLDRQLAVVPKEILEVKALIERAEAFLNPTKPKLEPELEKPKSATEKMRGSFGAPVRSLEEMREKVGSLVGFLQGLVEERRNARKPEAEKLTPFTPMDIEVDGVAKYAMINATLEQLEERADTDCFCGSCKHAKQVLGLGKLELVTDLASIPDDLRRSYDEISSQYDGDLYIYKITN